MWTFTLSHYDFIVFFFFFCTNNKLLHACVIQPCSIRKAVKSRYYYILYFIAASSSSKLNKNTSQHTYLTFSFFRIGGRFVGILIFCVDWLQKATMYLFYLMQRIHKNLFPCPTIKFQVFWYASWRRDLSNRLAYFPRMDYIIIKICIGGISWVDIFNTIKDIPYLRIIHKSNPVSRVKQKQMFRI